MSVLATALLTTLFMLHLPSIHTRPFDLEEGVMMTYVRNLYTWWSIGVNASPDLGFIFLSKMNHQFLNTIKVFVYALHKCDC
jgi:hypothetical protein